MVVRQIAMFVCACGISAWAAASGAPPGDPKLTSLYPFAVQRGTHSVVTVRGTRLSESTAVFVDHTAFTASIEKVESAGKDKGTADAVRMRVEVSPDAKPGRYSFRLVTPGGISNALPLHIVDQPVIAEPAGPHETPETAVLIAHLPAIRSGRIERRGESDYYALDVKAGQPVTFEVISGLPTIGAAGAGAAGFDPSLTLFEPAGSWFDAKRLKRIAFNDEPLWVLGQPTDASLAYKFDKAGRYLLRVEAFSGQGGLDYGYQLRVFPGEISTEPASTGGGWRERAYERRLSANRLNELAARGGMLQDQKPIETYRAAAGSKAPLFKIPGTLEGDLSRPGETHAARFHIDGPNDIALEIETPGAAPPLFNPVVRLLDASGREVATNVSVGRGACNGEMNKSLQSKTIVPLRDAGDYTIEIRDATTDLAGPGFRYRVQVRPQIPHLGDVKIDEDYINLAPGDAKTVRVVFDREEGFTGAVAVAAESLPPGVQALAGADFEPDKDPPGSTGKRERYTPRTERAVVVFTASDDAPATIKPEMVRLVVRSVTNSKPGPIVSTKVIPIMVVAKP